MSNDPTKRLVEPPNLAMEAEILESKESILFEKSVGSEFILIEDTTVPIKYSTIGVPACISVFDNDKTGWNVCYDINPEANFNEGLVIFDATYRGRSVVARGSMPFVLVSYSETIVDQPKVNTPYQWYKEGVGPTTEWGKEYVPIPYYVPNGIPSAKLEKLPKFSKSNINEFARVEHFPPSMGTPAHFRISARFQTNWTQYVQSWTFFADGRIEPGIFLGGTLNPIYPTRAHLRAYYYHLEFSIGRFTETLAGGKYQALLKSGVMSPQNAVREGMTYWNPHFWLNSDVIAGAQKAASMGEGIPVPDSISIQTPAVVNLLKAALGCEIIGRNVTRQQIGIGSADYWIRGVDSSYINGADNWQQIAKSIGHPASAFVPPKDEGLIPAGQNGAPIKTPIAAWFCMREFYKPRPYGEEQDFVPYEYTNFLIRVRNALNHSPPESWGGKGDQGEGPPPVKVIG